MHHAHTHMIHAHPWHMHTMTHAHPWHMHTHDTCTPMTHAHPWHMHTHDAHITTTYITLDPQKHTHDTHPHTHHTLPHTLHPHALHPNPLTHDTHMTQVYHTHMYKTRHSAHCWEGSQSSALREGAKVSGQEAPNTSYVLFNQMSKQSSRRLVCEICSTSEYLWEEWGGMYLDQRWRIQKWHIIITFATTSYSILSTHTCTHTHTHTPYTQHTLLKDVFFSW